MSGGGLYYITNNPSVKIKDFATSLCTREALFSLTSSSPIFIQHYSVITPVELGVVTTLKEPKQKNRTIWFGFGARDGKAR